MMELGKMLPLTSNVQDEGMPSLIPVKRLEPGDRLVEMRVQEEEKGGHFGVFASGSPLIYETWRLVDGCGRIVSRFSSPDGFFMTTLKGDKVAQLKVFSTVPQATERRWGKHPEVHMGFLMPKSRLLAVIGALFPGPSTEWAEEFVAPIAFVLEERFRHPRISVIC